MPDGTSRFSTLDGEPILHYMGCSTFSNFTVLPEIAVAKVREDAPFDKICYIGCGVTTGIGAVINTAKVEIGAKAVVFGLGGIGLNVIQGLKLAGADMIIGVDLNNDKKEWGERFGMTHFVNPKEVDGSVVQHIVNLTKTKADQIGGADYSFDCTGNVKVMRDALECTHRGWGVSVVIGVAPAGAEIATRPFQLVTGRVWKGTAFGGARGRTDVPKIVDWYMDGKIQIDPMITHLLRLEDINRGLRPDARGRVDPVGGGLLTGRGAVQPRPGKRLEIARLTEINGLRWAWYNACTLHAHRMHRFCTPGRTVNRVNVAPLGRAVDRRHGRMARLRAARRAGVLRRKRLQPPARLGADPRRCGVGRLSRMAKCVHPCSARAARGVEPRTRLGGREALPGSAFGTS